MSARRTRSHRDNRCRGRTDRGATVVIFAVCITGLLAVSSLVLGGSTGYSAVRNAQNAADASSLAATSTLRNVALGTAAAADVRATAESVAEDNGADDGTVQCDVVTALYAVSNSESEVIGPCDGTNEVAANASGVRVRVGDTRDVPLGAFVDRETITGEAVAAATVQPVRGGFRAPFMLCAEDRAEAGHGVKLLLDDPTLDPPYRINPDAFGIDFLLWSNGNGFGARECGQNQWRGLANSNRAYRIPSDPTDDDGWWEVSPGSQVGHIPRIIAGDDGCDWASEDDVDAAAGCRLALPLCIANVGNGTNARFNCVRLATFQISYVGDGEAAGSCVSLNKKVVCGELQPGGLAADGQGSLEPADPSELAVIKLVE